MYLYIATFQNNKKYIGITNNFNKRKTIHESRAKNNYNGVFYNAIRKYGFKNISWIVADGYQSWDALCDIEKELIKTHNTCCLDLNSNGYNMTRGGDGRVGFKHTDKWKQMMSEKMSGENSPSYGRKLTDEQKDHLSKINSGKLHPRYGKHRTEKQKLAMEQGFQKYCEDNGHPWVGKKHSEKSKQKISKANSGKNNGMYGKISPNKGKKNKAAADRMKGTKNPMYGRTGENHPRAKLTYEKAEEIKTKYKTGLYTQKQLSEEFSISKTQISNIIQNKVWVKK